MELYENDMRVWHITSIAKILLYIILNKGTENIKNLQFNEKNIGNRTVAHTGGRKGVIHSHLLEMSAFLKTYLYKTVLTSII